MEWYWIAATVAGYAMVGGIVGVKVDDSGLEEPGAFFAGLFWPLALPVALGVMVAKFSPTDWLRNRHRGLLAQISNLKEERSNLQVEKSNLQGEIAELEKRKEVVPGTRPLEV